MPKWGWNQKSTFEVHCHLPDRERSHNYEYLLTSMHMTCSLYQGNKEPICWRHRVHGFITCGRLSAPTQIWVDGHYEPQYPHCASSGAAGFIADSRDHVKCFQPSNDIKALWRSAGRFFEYDCFWQLLSGAKKLTLLRTTLFSITLRKNYSWPNGCNCLYVWLITFLKCIEKFFSRTG